jgi:hypothetical protein
MGIVSSGLPVKTTRDESGVIQARRKIPTESASSVASPPQMGALNMWLSWTSPGLSPAPPSITTRSLSGATR